MNQAGVDKYTVHQALNHVDDSMRNTDMYIKKSYDGNDLANRKVLDLSGIGVLLKQKYSIKFCSSNLLKQKCKTLIIK